MAKIDKITLQSTGVTYDIDVPVGTGTPGQVLSVNDAGTGTEWKTPQSGSSSGDNYIDLTDATSPLTQEQLQLILENKEKNIIYGSGIYALSQDYDRERVYVTHQSNGRSDALTIDKETGEFSWTFQATFLEDFNYYFSGEVGSLIVNTVSGYRLLPPSSTNGQVLTLANGSPVWANIPSSGGGGGGPSAAVLKEITNDTYEAAGSAVKFNIEENSFENLEFVKMVLFLDSDYASFMDSEIVLHIGNNDVPLCHEMTGDPVTFRHLKNVSMTPEGEYKMAIFKAWYFADENTFLLCLPILCSITIPMNYKQK